MRVSIAHADYAELRRRYFESTSAPDAAQMIRTGRIEGELVNLDKLLRHHREGAIRAKETWYRDYVDELLHFYSILEVASIAGVLSTGALDDEDRRTAMLALTHPAVQRYYQRNYPLLLPLLFNRRLTGPNLVEGGGLSRALFNQFLSLSRIIEGNKAVDTFLWFLDGGTYRDRGDWVDIDDTLEALRSAEAMARLLKQQRPGPLARSLDGFRTFAIFCQEFDAFLSDIRDVRLLRDAFWHAHAYWFQRMGKRLGATMNKAIDNLLQAASVSGGSVQAVDNTMTDEERQALKAEIQRNATNLKAAVSRLTLRTNDPRRGGQYGTGLNAVGKRR